mgnify:CR=1 FL=1
MHSQILTEQEAISFAQKLNETEILSDQGKTAMIQFIKNGAFLGMPRRDPLGTKAIDTPLTKTLLLNYLSSVFELEMYYRLGYFEQKKIEKELRSKYSFEPRPTKEEADQIMEYYESRMLAFEGRKIEESILSTSDTTKIIRQFFRDLPVWTRDYDLEFEKYPQSVSHTRSTLGKTWETTLSDLLKIQLIDQKVYQGVLDLIEVYDLQGEADIFKYAAQKMIFFKNFAESKRKELSFINNLHQKGILSKDNLEKLLASYQDWELKKKFDYLNYCNHAKTFDIRDYPNDPVFFYREMFKEIKIIIPEFDFLDLQISAVEKPFENRKGGILFATVKFTLRDKPYENDIRAGHIQSSFPDTSKLDTVISLDNHFYTSVNKFLADIRSEQRLYFTRKRHPKHGLSHHEFGLILLTEEQANAWDDGTGFLSQEQHNNQFNTANIQKAIEQYQMIGLFNHLTPQEIEKGKNKVKKSAITGYQDILYCFPKNIVFFDGEMGNLDNPYEEFVQIYSLISRGAFTPTNIVDRFQQSWEKPTTYFAFEFGGKLYEITLKMQDDWLDFEVDRIIRQALTENQVDGNFHLTEHGGTLFLTKSQYEFLQKEQPSLFMKL